MTDPAAPYHAHIYYSSEERETAAALRDGFGANPDILLAGPMTDRPVGPHPVAQYEVHFLANRAQQVIAAIEASGLTALVHPLTQDDLADHTALAHWIGEPLELDLSVLDPPGENKGVPRFGVTDF